MSKKLEVVITKNNNLSSQAATTTVIAGRVTKPRKKAGASKSAAAEPHSAAGDEEMMDVVKQTAPDSQAAAAASEKSTNGARAASSRNRQPQKKYILPKQHFLELIKLAGHKSIVSSQSVGLVELILLDKLKPVLRTALMLTDHAKKKTITKAAFVHALNEHKSKLYITPMISQQ